MKLFFMRVMVWPFLLLFFTYAAFPCSEAMGGENVRSPVVAGVFYPSSPTQLRNTVTKLLDSVPRLKPAGSIVGALAPHAGYVYSGAVAAYTHKLLSFVHFDTLIIIGHDTYADAVALTCPVDYFRTPLGKVPVDREMMEKLHESHSGIKPHRPIHERDHTIEVHLPFLQAMGRQCKILPILFGSPTVSHCQILSHALRAAAGKKRIFLLASTDMSHYPSYEAACKIDASTLEVLQSLDVEKLFAHLKARERDRSIPNLQTALCAKGAVGTTIFFAKASGADALQILRYANSGDVPQGDKHQVVGYCSALMVKTPASTSR